MTPPLKSYLCVGGPHAGKRYMSNGPSFRAVLPDSPGVQDLDIPVRTRTVEYRIEHFGTPQGTVTFWTPVGQTPLETITLLLDTYERHYDFP